MSWFSDFIGGLPGIGTFVSGVGSIFDAASSNEYNREYLAMQREENQKNREFQSEEAEKQRLFTADQQIKNNEYNSAPAQVKRMQQAGVNPATAFSNSAGSAGSVTPAPMGGIPSGTAGISGLPYQGLMSKFGLAGAYLESLASAYKSSEEGSVVKKRSEAEIAKLFSEQNLNDLRAKGQEIANMIASKTGLQEKRELIANLIADTDLKVANKAKAIAEKGLTEARTNREIEQLVGDVYDNVRKQFESLLGKTKYRMALIDLKYHEAEVVEGLQTQRSVQAANYAGAEKSRSEADVAKIRAKIDNLEFDIKNGHKYDYANSLIEQWQRDGDISKAAAAEARQRLKAINEGSRSATEIDKFIRWLSSAVGVSVSLSN